MASSLTGLMRQLTWADFATRRGPAPSAGSSATAAFTDARFRLSGLAFRHDPAEARGTVSLVDSLHIAISLHANSFKMNWLASQPAGFQADLLNHEQGHYWITALLARDLFVDMMLEKSEVYANDAAGMAAFNAIKADSVDKNQAIQDMYDREVHPEQAQSLSRGPIQQQWDTIFRSAFTNPRASGTTTPDGTPHKARLVVVIRASGRTI
jgi:hypothetical protein